MKTHAFLTHTWRKDDLGRDNHARVSRVNDALKRRGIITWFDEDRMTGQIRQAMTEALYSTCCVIVFVTREYEKKVNSADLSDNCYYEFNIASNDKKLTNKRIPVIMDRSMNNPSGWAKGRLQAELGGILSLDFSNDATYLENDCDTLVKTIYDVIMKK
jgi:hypothetical protein